MRPEQLYLIKFHTDLIEANINSSCGTIPNQEEEEEEKEPYSFTSMAHASVNVNQSP